MKTYDQLKFLIKSVPVINTHSHHRPESLHMGLTLTELFRNSYVYWSGVLLDDNKTSREEFLSLVRYRSYFVWLEKAIREIYGIEHKLTADNWDYASSKIEKAHKDPVWHLKILSDYCNYEKTILDAYWDAGSNNGNGDVFYPSFRVDTLMFGWNPLICDHNGISFRDRFGECPGDIDSYMDFARKIICNKLNGDSIALKSAIAYDRGLDFDIYSKEQAGIVFEKAPESVTGPDIKAFQDFVFFEICNIAAEFDVPLQIHTGLGKLEKSNPMQLQKVISRNPKTKFVLFHGGFPWTDEISGLMHVYANVYADICWLPLISPTAAVNALSEYIEVGTADKITWGCDTMTGEESYGAKIAVTEVVAKVLGDKIEAGYITFNDAKVIIKNIFYDNPVKLYKFKKSLLNPGQKVRYKNNSLISLD